MSYMALPKIDPGLPNSALKINRQEVMIHNFDTF